MAGDPNLYDGIERAIAEARSSLPSDGAAADAVSQWSADDLAQIDRLQKEYEDLQRHREMALGVASASEPTRCVTCGEPRPCPAASALAAQYEVTGEGADGSSGAYDTLTAAQRSADKSGQCACGLYGQQAHQRVSGPGVEPEVWVRTAFECKPTRPGPHFRLD